MVQQREEWVFTAAWNRPKRLIKLILLLPHTKPMTDAFLPLMLSVTLHQPVEMLLSNQGTKLGRFLQSKVRLLRLSVAKLCRGFGCFAATRQHSNSKLKNVWYWEAKIKNILLHVCYLRLNYSPFLLTNVLTKPTVLLLVFSHALVWS